MALLTVREVEYTYQAKYHSVQALKGVSCGFDTGRIYAIVGHSGSGKTTLLSLLAGLDTPTAGEILVDDISMTKINRDRYRRETAAVVYQSFHLFPLLNAVENVMYPMQLRGVIKKQATKKAKGHLCEVGLNERIYRQYPLMMSGGEQQRVAIARALASDGKIILCDEPTGNLDTENSEVVVTLLQRLAHERNYCVIVVTHDLDVAAKADMVYRMKDGRLDVEREGL